MAKKGRKSSGDAGEDKKKEKKPCVPKSTLPEINPKELFATYMAIRDVMENAFDEADRINLETNWGTYMIFQTKRDDREFYFVHSGNTCDYKQMPPNMEYFPSMHDVLKFIVTASILKKMEENPQPEEQECAHRICKNLRQKKGIQYK